MHSTTTTESKTQRRTNFGFVNASRMKSATEIGPAALILRAKCSIKRLVSDVAQSADAFVVLLSICFDELDV